MSGSASRSASSKHGRRRPEQPCLCASVDGEARQETSLLTASLSRSFARSVVRCRWRRRVESPHDDHRTTSHSKQLEALSDVLSFELRSSRLLELSSRLLCSISNVELHCSLESDSPGQNSRADTNCTENNCARSILARTRLFRRAGDHMTFGPPAPRTRQRDRYNSGDASGEVRRATQTQHYTRAHKTN